MAHSKSVCWTCAGEPDGGSPTKGVADGWSSGLRHLYSNEKERRPLLSDRQHGGSIFSCCVCVCVQIEMLFLSLSESTLRLHQYILIRNQYFQYFASLQYECQYCQYHVKAQYKKMSSKRAELQSSFSGKAPNKVKGGGLRERLCQDGFYYGGVSSAACAASLWVMFDVVISQILLLMHGI